MGRWLAWALVVACGGESEPAADASDPEPEPACEPGEAGELVADRIEHDGVERTFMRFVPSDFDCTERPLVIGLHGYFGSGRGFAQGIAQLVGELEGLGWIGVFPDGEVASATGYGASVTSFNDLTSRFDDGPEGPTCTDDAFEYVAYDNCGPAEETRSCRWGTSCADDAGFIRALIASTAERYPIASDRVLLTGFSQGGQTAAGLACALADVVSVVAPVHGTPANGHTCAPTSPVSLVQVVGRADQIVNAFDAPSSDGMIYDSAAEVAEAWATAQGCEAPPVPIRTPSDGVRGWACEEHPECATSARVVSCVWDGAHVWGGASSGEPFTWAVMRDEVLRRSW